MSDNVIRDPLDSQAEQAPASDVPRADLTTDVDD
jgi:hypothetical protein